MSSVLFPIHPMFTLIAILISLTAIHATPLIGITVSPSTVISSPLTAVTLTATAYSSAGTGCAITSYSWNVDQSPSVTGRMPIFWGPNLATTNVTNWMHGLYLLSVTVQDCQGSANLQVPIRVVGGKYDTAHIISTMDGFGTFFHNGDATTVNGYQDADALVMDIANVASGDIFAMVGTNTPLTGTRMIQTNPAMVAASITWRDVTFNTNSTNWKCTAGDVTGISGSTAWTNPGYVDTIFAPAVSQGANMIGTFWANQNNGPLLIAPGAQFLWTTSTANFPLTDQSTVSCRMVLTPPPEITVGIQSVSSPGFVSQMNVNAGSSTGTMLPLWVTGLIIGVLLLVILIIVGGCWRYRQMAKKQSNEAQPVP